MLVRGKAPVNSCLACGVMLALYAIGTMVAADNTKIAPSVVRGAAGPMAEANHVSLDLVRELDGSGGYIRLEGRFLFLTSDVNSKVPKAGFWFDIGLDPAAPALLDKSLPGAWDVAIAGDHAFVCDYTKALTVYDLRQRPWRQVAKLDMPSMTENITIRGKLAYVANHTAGLTIVDIADPLRPSLVSNFNPRIDCDGLALWKDCAVLYGHHESRIVLVDVADPAKPRQMGVYQHDKGSFNQGEVEVEGGFAYCTSVNGLVIVNITDPSSPKLAKTVDLKGVTDVIVKDGYAFVAAGINGVHMLDVTDPARPTEVASYTAPAILTASQLAVQRVAQASPAASGQAQGPAKAAVDLSPTIESPAPLGGESFYLYVANRSGPALIMRFAGCATGARTKPSALLPPIGAKPAVKQTNHLLISRSVVEL